MTKEEKINQLNNIFAEINEDDNAVCYLTSEDNELIKSAIEALEQEPQTFEWCTDCREYDQEKHCCHRWSKVIRNAVEEIKQAKFGHCKDCKFFEYDHVSRYGVSKVPVILAHEICTRWGNGCKTKEDGYCFLFEPQESEES